MDGEKKRKSKKKSKRDDMDFIDEEIARAMRQMEKAMETTKIAQESAAHMTEAFSGMNGITMGNAQGITVNHFGNPSGNNPIVFVSGAQNMQVGNHNVMNITSDGKMKKKKPKASRVDSNSDTGVDDNPIRETRAEPVRPKQRSTQNQERVSSHLTPAEEKQRLILNSTRLISDEDIKLCSVSIGQFPRFLRRLGLDDSQIDSLKEEHHSAREIIYQGMQLWKQKLDKEATLGAVARALQKSDCADIINYFKP